MFEAFFRRLLCINFSLKTGCLYNSFVFQWYFISTHLIRISVCLCIQANEPQQVTEKQAVNSGQMKRLKSSQILAKIKQQRSRVQDSDTVFADVDVFYSVNMKFLVFIITVHQ